MERLLCIVSSLDTGGAETFLMKIFRKLPEDYRLDFIVSSIQGFYEKEVLDLGGRIFRVPLRTKHPIRTYKAIKKIVRDNQYTCVLKLCDTPIGVFDLMAAKAGGAKKLSVRSCNAGSDEGRLRHFANQLLRPVMNYISDVKIAPSVLAAEYTFGKKAVQKDQVFPLHNAVDLNFYTFCELDRKKCREELQISETQVVVGHIGRFNNQKNHTFLLNVFSEIHKKCPETKLLLVGGGELEPQIRTQINQMELDDAVILTGVRSDIPRLLSAMDVFVFPSLYEGMPNTVIEAQATGLPCVIADTITKEADITGIVHYMSLHDTPKQWAEKALQAGKEKRHDVAAVMVEKGYDIQSVTQQFVRLVFDERKESK